MSNWHSCERKSAPWGGVFDLDNKRQQTDRLEERSADPAIWNDPQAAKAVMRDLSGLRDAGEHLGQARAGRGRRASRCWKWRRMTATRASWPKSKTEAARLRQRFERLAFQLAFSGKYDRNDAILSIHAGAGGTEAQDWASMLLRMFLRWAERRGYDTEITNQLEGEEAGIKTVTLEARGAWAYGYLRAERGVHRLVRISPFDSAARRHTSFALVEVLPLLDDDIEVDINPSDVKMDVYRAGSAGGQHMQKNSTAVRLTHIPTGIVVTCQNERSQLQNRESAMHVLRGKLYDLEFSRLEEEQARLKGKHVEAGWGNQIRSYVLQPYQMVKDLRTEVETGNTAAVLDGEIDPFIEAWLKEQVGVEDGGA